MDRHSSRLFQAIQDHQSNTPKEERSNLLKKFALKKINDLSGPLLKKNVEGSRENEFHYNDTPKSDNTNRNEIIRIPNESSVQCQTSTYDSSPLGHNKSINLSSDNIDSMEIESNTPCVIGKDVISSVISGADLILRQSNDYESRISDLDLPSDSQGLLASENVPMSSTTGEILQKKKCLDKEIRPDINCVLPRRDSISTLSNRSSLEPINEEMNSSGIILPDEDNDSSIEIEELDTVLRPCRERSSSLRSSNRPSLEPIHEDVETMDIDTVAPAEDNDGDENLVEETNQETKRRSSRNSKSPLETITEEQVEVHDESRTEDALIEKLPLTFPSNKKDFTWFDLQSPMIKPSRKRRFEEDQDELLLSSSDDLNSSCEDITLPYNVHDYRRSVHLTGSDENDKGKTESSPVRSINSTGSSQPGAELANVLADLRVRVQKHENSIHKISEVLHASRGVNANLSEHLIHCHRNLLIERQSRQLIMEEIDRQEKCQVSRNSDNFSHGNLIVNNICLYLKPVESQISTEEPCDEEFYFICLLKCPSGQLVPSDMVSVSRQSRRGKLEFRSKFSLSQVPSDFVIHLEVYAMTLIRRSITGIISQEAVIDDDNVSITSSTSSASMPHMAASGGVKRLRFIKKLLTPSKSNKRMISESVENSVSEDDDEGWRTTGFSVLSSVKLTKDTVNQTNFYLGKIPHLYPLTGQMAMNISLNHGQDNIEERGFLSVFSHVGGFGAWQRLWCVLKPSKILMWRYPNEEANALDYIRAIDLNDCISERVTLATKDVCFRPQTLIMEMVSNTNVETPSQLLLSADTKADRLVWCNKLNRTLNCLRSWNPSRFEELHQRFKR